MERVNLMSEPIRVAMIMGKMVGGGVEAVVMNYYRHIDKDLFQFDFIIDNDSSTVPEMEINTLGGRIYRVAPYQKIVEYRKDLKKIFKQVKYEIVHSHINSLSVIPLQVAKQCDVPIRIAHNHSTAAPGEYKKNLVKRVLKMFSTKFATNFMAPSRYAGEWLFGKKIADNELYILKNAIELDKFLFDESIRKEVRESLSINDNEFVIGNIGRFVWQKNQDFVLDIFQEYKKKNENSKLILVGSGPNEENLIHKIKDYNLTDSVLVLGNRSDVSDIYQALDFFVFPSRYEGLGIVAIEAQTNGLHVIGSDRIPDDVKITSLYSTLSLDAPYSCWVREIENTQQERNNKILEIRKAGYDIKIESVKLVDYYNQLLGKNQRISN